MQLVNYSEYISYLCRIFGTSCRAESSATKETEIKFVAPSCVSRRSFRWSAVLISRSWHKEALRIAQNAILAVVLALRKLTLSLTLTVCIVVIWHENSSIYINISISIKYIYEKITYTYTSCELGNIHDCICTHDMYICTSTGCPWSSAFERCSILSHSAGAAKFATHRFNFHLQFISFFG